MTFIPNDLYIEILHKLPIVCVDLLIIYNDKCLLLKRDNEPEKGKYWFPGGRILKCESIKDAAIRKAKEETNLECTFDRIISVEETVFKKSDALKLDIHTINICSLLSVDNIDDLKIDSNHNNHLWISELTPNLHEAIINPLKLLGFS